MDKHTTTDVILIGAGIMSATLGSLLKELDPNLSITIYERLASAGEESSNEWNNAGTGHAALCELNYTVEKPDGSVDISKAIKINEQFQVSMQFWSYLVNNKRIEKPQDFIRQLPHMSFVQGEENLTFLKNRFNKMATNPLFQGMEFSENPSTLEEWVPLMMKDRVADEPIGATKIDTGTDVNFGALTRKLISHLKTQNVAVNYHTSVETLKQTEGGLWEVETHHLQSGSVKRQRAKFVFIGAGGGSLHLLQKSGIPEGKGIGGFPVSGLFLVCNNPFVVEQHNAKVYGKAKVGAPPMSVPHLDTRYIDNKKSLLFGPFAGFSPRFLKSGSLFDLVNSVKPNNVLTMLSAGAKEMALTKYLLQQVTLTKEERVEELREFIPNANSEDWDIVVAGQRVQVIKDTEAGGKGTLQFGTEVITATDGSIAALLGASPGASTAVHVMLEVIEKCFPQNLETWQGKIKEMIQSYGRSLVVDPMLLAKVQSLTTEALQLKANAEAERTKETRVLQEV